MPTICKGHNLLCNLYPFVSEEPHLLRGVLLRADRADRAGGLRGAPHREEEVHARKEEEEDKCGGLRRRPKVIVS